MLTMNKIHFLALLSHPVEQDAASPLTSCLSDMAETWDYPQCQGFQEEGNEHSPLFTPGKVLWTPRTSFKLNSTICVKVARRHGACFEILREGGAQPRRLVSHFHPRLCRSVPVPPPRSYASLGLGSQARPVAAPRRWLLGGWAAPGAQSR